MKLVRKELDALIWLSEQADLGALNVAVVRDQSDVGWLEVLMKQAKRHSGRSSHLEPLVKFKVSPLGHVYNESGEVVREGPALGPDGQRRTTTRV
jgi:hypothetical protein